MRERMNQALETARRASDDQWAEMKERLISRFADGMKERNSDDATVQKAAEEIDEILEKTRKLSDKDFEDHRSELVKLLLQAMRKGMGTEGSGEN